MFFGHSGRDGASDLDEAADIVGDVGHADLCAGPLDADGADSQFPHVLLNREDMLDRSAAAGTCRVAAADVPGHGAAFELAMVGRGL